MIKSNAGSSQTNLKTTPSNWLSNMITALMRQAAGWVLPNPIPRQWVRRHRRSSENTTDANQGLAAELSRIGKGNKRLLGPRAQAVWMRRNRAKRASKTSNCLARHPLTMKPKMEVLNWHRTSAKHRRKE